MNELIKQLAKEHLVRDEHTEFGWQECHKYVFDPEELSKFVELLLKDVLVIVKNNTPDPDPYNEDYDERAAAERTANDIRDDIKYRFGVSE